MVKCLNEVGSNPIKCLASSQRVLGSYGELRQAEGRNIFVLQFVRDMQLFRHVSGENFSM